MLLYEGKAKQIYSTENENEYIVHYKDDATAFNGEKKAEISSKGILNNKISTIIFEMLHKEQIKTHFIKNLSEREMLVKKVEILPLEVIVRNITAGSFCKRFGIEEGALVGISSGAAIKVALDLAKKVGKGKKILVIAPDGGEKYISTGLYD